MKCPKCGAEAERDEVDVGVGSVPAGPYGCFECGWVQEAPRELVPDVVCAHGVAMDVHCCGCHSGFLFDGASCTCLNAKVAVDAHLGAVGE